MLTVLRQKLLEITGTVPLLEHPARIKALLTELDHSIVVTDSEHSIERYTCGVQAFYLVEDPTYLEIAGFGLGLTFAGPEFVAFLLRNSLLSKRDKFSALPGDLILYFDNGTFRHVGRMKTNYRVVSKWGTGFLYEHDVWEVPSSYGEEIQYFVGPDENASFDLFVIYAKSKGFR